MVRQGASRPNPRMVGFRQFESAITTKSQLPRTVSLAASLERPPTSESVLHWTRCSKLVIGVLYNSKGI